MSQKVSKTLTPFESLCKFIDLSQNENNSVALIAYHNDNAMEEVLIDLARKFPKLNVVQMNITSFNDLAQSHGVNGVIRETSKEHPDLLIFKGYEGNSIEWLEGFSNKCYYPILLFFPPKEMSLFLQRHGAYFTTKPYFKF